MKKKTMNILSFSLCIFSMILLILDSKYAIEGAKDGIILCLYTVIPTLFPFCVLSIIFRSMISYQRASVLHPFERLCGMPEGCGTIFLLGLLGGYPIGAICIEQAVKEKSITPHNAKYLRAVCNNAGPSFIIGMLSESFRYKPYLFILLLIQGLSAILSCLILCRKANSNFRLFSQKTVKLTDAVKQACASMSNVCGIIVLFRVFMNIANHYLSSFVSTEIWVALVGILELTNGVHLLTNLMHEELIFMAAAGLLSFGGICVALQTISVSSPGAGKHYLIGKTIQAMIAVMLAYFYIKIGCLFIIIYIILFACIRIFKTVSKNKHNISKNSRNSDLYPV